MIYSNQLLELGSDWIKKHGIFTKWNTMQQKDRTPFATAWVELESIMISEISQAVRDKYHMISPLTGT